MLKRKWQAMFLVSIMMSLSACMASDEDSGPIDETEVAADEQSDTGDEATPDTVACHELKYSYWYNYGYCQKACYYDHCGNRGYFCEDYCW